jgi:hypothetical protein
LGLDHQLFVKERILDSGHPAIHPANSTPDQHEYDPSVHPAKEIVTFDLPVYREIVCFVALREITMLEELMTHHEGLLPYSPVAGD